MPGPLVVLCVAFVRSKSVYPQRNLRPRLNVLDAKPWPHSRLLAGFRYYRLESDMLSACSDVAHPFNDPTTGCESLDRRVLAIQTDPTCLVRIYVLGDSQCSNARQLAVMDG